MSKEHLVVSDMQTKFINEDSVFDLELKKNILKKIILDFRARHIPITYTFFWPEIKFGPIIPDLQPMDYSEIVSKENTSAFSSFGFIQRINDANLLYITGCNLHACIKLTVEDAVKKGLDVVVFDNATFASKYYPRQNRDTRIKFFFMPRVKVRKYINA
jgi:nicotinamidase-related amidase